MKYGHCQFYPLSAIWLFAIWTTFQGLFTVALADDPLPTTEKTTDIVTKTAPESSNDEQDSLLFHLLAAEVAANRRQLPLALKHYQLAVELNNHPDILRQATHLALLANEHPTALNLAKRWLKIAPDDLQAQQTYLLTLLRNDRVEEAVKHTTPLMKSFIKDKQDGYSHIKSILDQVDNKTTTLKFMQTLQNQHHDSRFAQYYLALVALQAEQTELALNTLDQAMDQHPKWPPLYLLKAQILFGNQQKKQALELLRQAVDRQPYNRALRKGYARLLTNTQYPDQARQQLVTLLEQNPDDNDTLMSLGQLAREQKRYQDALIHFSRLLQRRYQINDVQFEIGHIAELQNKPDEALQWYKKINAGGKFIPSRVRIGHLLAQQGKTDQVNNLFTGLRQRFTQHKEALFMAEAEILTTQAQHQQAFDILTEGLESSPDNTELLYSRALAAERINRLDVLEQDLRKILVMDPNNAHALNALGYTLADRTTRYQEAQGYLQKAIRQLPNDPAVMDSMGWVLYRLNRPEEALSYLQKAHDTQQNDEIAAHLAEVLWSIDRHKEALTLCISAKQSTPDSTYIKTFENKFSIVCAPESLQKLMEESQPIPATESIEPEKNADKPAGPNLSTNTVPHVHTRKLRNEN